MLSVICLVWYIQGSLSGATLHKKPKKFRVSAHCRGPRRILGFSYYSIFRKMYFVFFSLRFGAWEGLQPIGNGRGLQMDGFSLHFEPSETISVDFHDFGHFGVDSIIVRGPPGSSILYFLLVSVYPAGVFQIVDFCICWLISEIPGSTHCAGSRPV